MVKIGVSKSHIGLLAVVVLAIFSRFSSFFEKVIFYGDHSRDFLTVYKIVNFHEWVWHGPAVSVVWALLSPIYYYFWIPFYLISNWNPLTQPALGGLLGVITTALFFVCFKNLWGTRAGTTIAFLYAISAVVIPENIVGTNPSLVPVGTVIFLWSTLKVMSGEDRYFPIGIAALSWVSSFHTSAVFLIPVLAILLIIKRQKISKRNWLIAISLFFVLTVIPYSIQEKKHGGYNLITVYNYVFAKDKGTQATVPLLNSFKNYAEIVVKTPADVLLPVPDTYVPITVGIVWFSLLLFLIKFRHNLNNHFGNLVIIATIYTLIFGLAVKFGSNVRPGWWFGNVFFPLVTIIWGYLLSKVKPIPALLVVLTVVLAANVLRLQIFETDQSFGRYAQEKKIAEQVLDDTGKENFNLKYIYKGGDESGAQGPFAYLFWYLDRPQFQEKYFRWLNWQKPPADFPLYLVFQETSPSGKEAWLDKYSNHNTSLVQTTNFYEIYKED